MATANPDMTRRFNLLATFPDRRAAEEAVGALQRRGLGEAAISVGSRAADREVAEAEMRDELEGFAGASRTMIRGSFAGGIIGAVVGAVVGFLVGAVVFGSSAGSSRIVGTLAAVVVFAAGLAIAGSVMGGFVKPRYRPDAGDVAAGETGLQGSAGEVVVGVHVDDERLVTESERVLAAANPLRMDLLGSRGEVLNTEETGLGDLPVQPGSGRVRDQEGTDPTA